MKKILFLLVCLLPLQLLAQEKFTVSGHVKDLKNGEDLIGVSVAVDGGKPCTITNVYGFYSLTCRPKITRCNTPTSATNPFAAISP